MTAMMSGNRKLVAFAATLGALLLAGWACTWAHPLPEKALEIVSYGITGCFGLYIGGNFGEHWSNRKPITKE